MIRWAPLVSRLKQLSWLMFLFYFFWVFLFHQVCLYIKSHHCKPGGLNLSRSCLDHVLIESLDLDKKKLILTVWKTTSRQSRFSWQFKNQVLTVSTTLKIEISQFLSISRSRVSISTVEKISTVWKTTSRRVETPTQAYTIANLCNNTSCHCWKPLPWC